MKALAVAEPAPAISADSTSRFLIWAMAAVLICLPVLLQARMDRNARSVDFVYFYTVSILARHSSPDKIYDPKLQVETAQKILPVRDGQSSYGFSPYPPFVALLFAPLSRLPFWTAFRVQQAISLALYLLGLIILLRRFFPGQPVWGSVFLPFALAYLPWISNTWLNGQISVLGFVGVALALVWLADGREFRAGLALSICLYKPTLLVLLIPMLVFRRQRRVLAGLAAGGGVLVSVATLAFGWHVWKAYARLVLSLGDLERLRQLPQYVDLSAFFALLIGSRLAGVFAVMLSLGGLALLMAAWRRYQSDPLLVWSATLTLTLVLSPYVPLYDTILIIPSLIASASGLHLHGRDAIPGSLILIFVCSWISAALAGLIHLQILTLAIAALGCLQIACLRSLPFDQAHLPARRIQWN